MQEQQIHALAFKEKSINNILTIESFGGVPGLLYLFRVKRKEEDCVKKKLIKILKVCVKLRKDAWEKQ